MKRPLDQIRALQAQHTKMAARPIPLIIAGDIFDRWNSPPELINFALRNLPLAFAVPGQHDLPHHSYESIKSSAYWTLVEAGRIHNLEYGKSVCVNNLRLHGFPYGFDVRPWRQSHDLMTEVAVVHSYIWTKRTGYSGAPEDSRLSNWWDRLKGYDVAVFGDNHSGFLTSPDEGKWVLNCGALIRRKLDERDYRPVVGLLHEDGSVSRHCLDCSADKFLTTSEIETITNGIGFETVIESLTDLGDNAINFYDAIERILERDKVSESVKKIILKVMEKG